jgi:hypothetical protein
MLLKNVFCLFYSMLISGIVFIKFKKLKLPFDSTYKYNKYTEKVCQT